MIATELRGVIVEFHTPVNGSGLELGEMYQAGAKVGDVRVMAFVADGSELDVLNFNDPVDWDTELVVLIAGSTGPDLGNLNDPGVSAAGAQAPDADCSGLDIVNLNGPVGDTGLAALSAGCFGPDLMFLNVFLKIEDTGAKAPAAHYLNHNHGDPGDAEVDDPGTVTDSFTPRDVDLDGTEVDDAGTQILTADDSGLGDDTLSDIQKTAEVQARNAESSMPRDGGLSGAEVEDTLAKPLVPGAPPGLDIIFLGDIKAGQAGAQALAAEGYVPTDVEFATEVKDVGVAALSSDGPGLDVAFFTNAEAGNTGVAASPAEGSGLRDIELAGTEVGGTGAPALPADSLGLNMAFLNNPEVGNAWGKVLATDCLTREEVMPRGTTVRNAEVAALATTCPKHEELRSTRVENPGRMKILWWIFWCFVLSLLIAGRLTWGGE